MTRVILLDTVVRLLAIGQLLLVALVIGRGAAPRPIRVVTVLLLLSIAGYLANATPLFRQQHGPFWPIIQLGSLSVPLLLWLFAHILFERRPNRLAALAAGGVVLASWAVFAFGDAGGPRWRIGAGIVQHVASLALLGHAIVIAIAERGDDLIEKRRRFRVGFVVIVGVQALAVVVVEMVLGFREATPVFPLAQSAGTLIAVLALGAVLLGSDPELLFDPEMPAPAPALSPSEHVLNQKLEAAMADAIFHESDLTIGVLAERLGTPEHRLRSLINQRLGYRNFSAFLNHHRIAEAKLVLADPAKVDLPVLTIAMDLGYGSLAPFNRAFREDTRQTPSEFRRESILPG